MRKEESVKLLLSGFFPRQHSKTKTIDTGSCGIDMCHYCGSYEFVWVSVEFCPNCGSIADYWQHGDESVEKIFKMYGRTKMEREYIEAKVRNLLQKHNISEKDYSLTIDKSDSFSFKI